MGKRRLAITAAVVLTVGGAGIIAYAGLDGSTRSVGLNPAVGADLTYFIIGAVCIVLGLIFLALGERSD